MGWGLCVLGVGLRARVAQAVCCALLLLSFCSASQAQITTTYTYDGAGRLVRAVDSNGPTVAYAYDTAGNRTMVGPGREAGEYTPVGFSSSSVLSGTSAPTISAMADAIFDAKSSIAATIVQAQPWIALDLGQVRNIARVSIGAANELSLGVDASDVNGALLEASDDGSTWVARATINGAVRGVYHQVILAGVSARYIRLRRDGSGQIALGDLRVYSTVSGEAGAVTVAPISISVVAGSSVSINPLANTQGLTLQAIDVQGSHGTATLSGGGQVIIYAATAGYAGADVFRYRVAAPDGSIGYGQVNVTVKSGGAGGGAPGDDGQAPVAVDDYVTIEGGGKPFRITPTANDLDNQEIVLASVGAATAYGANLVYDTATGIVTYTPWIFANGAGAENEVIEYRVRDNYGNTRVDPGGSAVDSVAKIHITIVNPPPPPNRAPTANNDVITLRSPPTTFDPRSNDTDPDNDATTIISVGIPEHGSVAINAGATLTYTPEPGYLGSDTFVYAISDGHGHTANATITVVLNRSPVSADDAVQAGVHTARVFDPRVNDTDADGDALTITQIPVGPSHGVATISGGGSTITYTPVSGYIGSDTLTYTVSDGAGGTATGTVNLSVVVIPVTWSSTDKNSAYTLSNGGLTVTRAGASTSSGYAMGRATSSRVGGKYYFEVYDSNISNSYIAAIGLAEGSASLENITVANNAIVFYTHDQSIRQGGTYLLPASTGLSGAATIRVAVDLDAKLFWVGGPGQPWNLNPVANPMNGTGGISFSSITGPLFPAYALINSGPTLTLNAGASAFSGTVPRGFAPWDASSGPMPNRAPVAGSDVAQTVLNVAKVFDPRANDTDADGDALTITQISVGPSHGVATISGGGTTITYTPTTGYIGSDSFTYMVSDGAGGTATGTVNLSVVVSPVTWSSTDKSSDYTLSNGGLTVTRTGSSASGYTMGRATTGRASGKYYFETYTSNNFNVSAIGLSESTASLGNITVANNAIVFYTHDQSIRQGGTYLVPASTSLTGALTIEVAVDLDAKLFWVGRPGQPWNLNPAANPVHGTGGISFSSITGALFPSYMLTSSGATWTLNAGASAFTGVAPRGFAPWDASFGPTPNVAPVATNDVVQTDRNVAKAFDPRTNDTDAEGDTLTVTQIVTQPSNGTAVISGGGATITYTPNTGYTGSDTLTYAISDGHGGTATATANISVSPS